jgi:heme/copper-type cytochrome/quinol oxidase subunit 2
MATNEDQLEVKTGFGSIITHGTTVFIVVALAALTFVALWEHRQRSEEHDEIACLVKLNLFMHTLPKDTPVTWRQIPQDYWPCLPRNIVDSEKTIR